MGCGTDEITTWNTINYPGDDVYINLTISSDQINKAGLTQFELKSNRQGIRPDGNEYIKFYSGDSPDNQPKLEVIYYVDTVNIAGTDWYYRNTTNNKATIILFGGHATTTSVYVNSIDNLEEKTEEKIEFIDGLIEGGFDVLAIKGNCILHGEDHAYYDGDETWMKDAAMWLRGQGYERVFLFDLSIRRI